MYNNIGEFRAEADRVWRRYVAQRPSFYRVNLDDPAHKELEWQDGYALYYNTKTSTLAEQLLGETSMRSNLVLLNNFGTASGSTSAIERGTVFDASGKRISAAEASATAAGAGGAGAGAGAALAQFFRQGSILNDGYWWPFKNDCWLLGGVNGLKRFHLAHTFPVPDDLLWDAREGRPRVLGRELLGLATFGYVWVAHFNPGVGGGAPVFNADRTNALGLVFAPNDRARAHGATLTLYLDALEGCRSLDDLKRMVFSQATPYERYDFAAVAAPPAAAVPAAAAAPPPPPPPPPAAAAAAAGAGAGAGIPPAPPPAHLSKAAKRRARAKALEAARRF
jgi:hypothetical protein